MRDDIQLDDPGDIWRLPLRSGKEGVDHQAQVDHCLKHRIAALGWGLESPRPRSQAEVLRRVEEAPWNGWGRRARRTIERFISAWDGDLVWTMHTDGTYRLGELRGHWRYDASAAAREVDCHQVRDARWAKKRLLASEVPGSVVRSFSGRGSSFSRITDLSGKLFSYRLFDRLVGRRERIAAPQPRQILKDLLDPYDVEDLVFVYLQSERGYFVLPGSRRPDTAGYEFVLVHPRTRKQAIVQVKSGNAVVDLGKLESAVEGTDHRAFAYSARGNYEGDADGRIEKLSDKRLLDFALSKPYVLPPRVREWFKDHVGAKPR